MYIETSVPRQTGDYAKLNSPKLQFSGSMCLQFYYHMYGAGMGTLTVNISGNTVFNASGDKGDMWRKAEVDVNLSGNYAVRDYPRSERYLLYFKCNNFQLQVLFPTFM